MLNDIKRTIDDIIDKYSNINPWSNVYGLARSLLALTFLLTLLFTGIDNLFPSVNDTLMRQPILDFEKLSIFYIFRDNLAIAFWFTVIILLSVISGYLPQLTSLLHWWVTISYTFSGIIIEGGDQIAAILTLLIIPIAITDNRVNHWHPIKDSNRPKVKLFVWTFFAIISLQVSVIYFHAFVAKLFVTEWLNGTATFYWFTHNIFGVPQKLESIFYILMSNKFIVVLITWGAMLIEFMLFSWLFIKRNKWNWKILFLIGVLFHFFIALIHGLVSFGLTMTAILILYFFPIESNLKFKKI